MIQKAETITYPTSATKTFVDAHIAEILKFAAVNGFNRQERHKLLHYEGGVATYDTTRITGYDFFTVDGDSVGFVVINRIHPNEASTSIFDTDQLTTTPIEYNNLVGEICTVCGEVHDYM